MVYQREPHARQLAFRDVAQPETFEERAELARRMLDELDRNGHLLSVARDAVPVTREVRITAPVEA